jgi:metallo-beta-lactamase class B
MPSRSPTLTRRSVLLTLTRRSVLLTLTRRSVLLTLTAVAIERAIQPTTLRADRNPDWTTPLPPFRIAGNLYYVGSRDLASYLVTTPQGHILINSNLTTSPAQIRSSVEKLGFHWKDMKILLISHAHFDHCAGSAQIKRETGAQYMVMDADVPVVESGGRLDFFFSSNRSFHFLPAKVDHALHHGEEVRLGNSLLTARKTAGHTKGCTTWTMQLSEAGKTYNTVIVGSPNVLDGYNLIQDPKYPQMAADFEHQFQTLNSLPCDIFLGSHGSYFNLLPKLARLKSSNKDVQNPFIDPTGYKAYIADRQQAFEKELAKQKSAHLNRG